MREVAWILNIALSTLSSWNDGFDKNMKPYSIPQNRGKKSKVTVEIVRTIIKAAERWKDNDKRIRIKKFSGHLNKEYKIELSDKSVRQILIASGFMGSVSGSAVANVAATGSFTIPMMKRVGYRPHVAGAIEAAASTGGQLMPPIMGAGAFLMAEFTNTSYLTIIKIALVPAFLYYMTVLLFVHFEVASL